MFTFKIYKTDGTVDEVFASALSCARASIESVLYDRGAMVTEENDLIKVSAEGLTAEECKDIVAGCFCDDAGLMYPEFHLIELQS
jgi:hypothetical protein